MPSRDANRPLEAYEIEPMPVVATLRLTSTTAGDLPLTRTLHRSRDRPSVIELGMHILCNVFIEV